MAANLAPWAFTPVPGLTARGIHFQMVGQSRPQQAMTAAGCSPSRIRPTAMKRNGFKDPATEGALMLFYFFILHDRYRNV